MTEPFCKPDCDCLICQLSEPSSTLSQRYTPVVGDGNRRVPATSINEAHLHRGHATQNGCVNVVPMDGMRKLQRARKARRT